MYGAQPWGSSGPYGKAQYVSGHFGSGGSSLPRLQPGEYFLVDENGAYLIDENGNYLIGKDS